MLAVVVHQRIGPGNLVLLAYNNALAKSRRNTSKPDVGLSDALTGNTMALGSQMALDHPATKVGKGGKNSEDSVIELVVAEG